MIHFQHQFSWALADLQGQCCVECQVKVHNDWIDWFMKRVCSMGSVPRGTAHKTSLL